MFLRKKSCYEFCHCKFRMFSLSEYRHVVSTHAQSVKVNLFPGQQISCHTGSRFGQAIIGTFIKKIVIDFVSML